MRLPLEDQRLLAWFVFGDEWNRALLIPGERGRKRRKHLREQAIRKVLMQDLRRRGARCATCSGYRRGKCEPNSDFYGDLMVTPTYLCIDWKPREATP